MILNRRKGRTPVRSTRSIGISSTETPDKLRVNQRLNYTYATLDRMSAEKRAGIKAQAADIFTRLDAGTL